MAVLDKKLSTPISDITLKSIDQSVVNWFKDDHAVIINERPVPVIYATAERFARAQREKGFRDEAGVLILPLVSIRRTTPSQIKERYAPESDETNLTIVKRIATSPISENERQPALQGNRITDPEYIKTSDETVYEVLQIPFPSFQNLEYEITVWSSYMTHQNLNQENIFKEFRAGRQYFYVDDYYFFGLLQNVTDQSNLDRFSDAEKVIRYNFRLVVQAYFIEKSKIKTFRTSSNTKINVTETSFPID